MWLFIHVQRLFRLVKRGPCCHKAEGISRLCKTGQTFTYLTLMGTSQSLTVSYNINNRLPSRIGHLDYIGNFFNLLFINAFQSECVIKSHWQWFMTLTHHMHSIQISCKTHFYSAVLYHNPGLKLYIANTLLLLHSKRYYHQTYNMKGSKS